MHQDVINGSEMIKNNRRNLKPTWETDVLKSKYTPSSNSLLFFIWLRQPLGSLWRTFGTNWVWVQHQHGSIWIQQVASPGLEPRPHHNASRKTFLIWFIGLLFWKTAERTRAAPYFHWQSSLCSACELVLVVNWFCCSCRNLPAVGSLHPGGLGGAGEGCGWGGDAARSGPLRTYPVLLTPRQH